MDLFKKHLAALLAPLAKVDEAQLLDWIELPPDPAMGDMACPCFRLAKTWRKAPAVIAQEIADGLSPDEIIERVEVAKAYVNVFLRAERIASDVLPELFEKGSSFAVEAGSGKTYVIDYSSPNVAKSFHFGHLRSTMIGHSLKRVLTHLGHEVIGINHLGDWGTQFGIVMEAYRRWGKDDELSAAREGGEGNRYLQSLYVRGSAEAKEDEVFHKATREAARRLEEGDAECRATWKRFLAIAMEEFDGLYERLGITFDHVQGESFYIDKLQDTVAYLEEKGVLSESKGAIVVDLTENDMPPCLVKKADGATLYATRDLAAARYRREHYDPDVVLYVHGAPQKLHFRQFFRVLEKCDPWWEGRLHHVDFGHYRFKDKKMSTRSGSVVFLADVIREGIKYVAEKIAATEAERGEALAERETVAEDVALGGIVFGDLVTDRVKDVVFDWDKILDFQGDTGPYVQYTHARLRAILRKADCAPAADVDFALLTHPEERQFCLRASRLSEVLHQTEKTFKPSILANFLLDTAKGLNRYYHGVEKIIHTEQALKRARLLLIRCAADFLELGLGLLNVKAPQQM